MIDWIGPLRGLAEPAALVTVLATEGSAPRGAGTRMLVTADAQHGTIGGGRLEYRAVEQARLLLAHPVGAWRVQDYPLGPLLGQCCGGRVRLLVEHVDPAGLGWIDAAAAGAVLETALTADGVVRRIAPDAPFQRPSARGERPVAGARIVERLGEYRRPLWLFGAGHVGQAIVRHAESLPFRPAWFDTRAEIAEAAGATLVDEAGLTRCVADAPADAAIVILTHDHGLDYALVRAALTRAATAYVGVIGSATKRARFLSKLARDEVDGARLTCPIGLPGIDGKQPDVIAVALLAQLLALGAA